MRLRLCSTAARMFSGVNTWAGRSPSVGGGWFTGHPHLLARKYSSRRIEMCSPISSSETP